MNFISSPLSFSSSGGGLTIVRDIHERISMLDNLVELIVFTRRGSFAADPDFGFEYWNHEYANVNEAAFNNSPDRIEHNAESAKFRCKESVRTSLASYAPELKEVRVDMRLDLADNKGHGSKKIHSRHTIHVAVEGRLEAGLATFVDYRTDVMFLMEPTAKRR